MSNSQVHRPDRPLTLVIHPRLIIARYQRRPEMHSMIPFFAALIRGGGRGCVAEPEEGDAEG